MSLLKLYLREFDESIIFDKDLAQPINHDSFTFVIPEGSFESISRVVERAVAMSVRSIAESLGASRTPQTPLDLAKSVGIKRQTPHFDEVLAPGPGTEFQRVDIDGKPNSLWESVRRVEAGPDEDGVYEVLTKFNRTVHIKHNGSAWIEYDY